MFDELFCREKDDLNQIPSVTIFRFHCHVPMKTVLYWLSLPSGPSRLPLEQGPILVPAWIQVSFTLFSPDLQ